MERIGNARRREARPEAADHNVIRVVAVAEDEPGDNTVSGRAPHESARADIAKLRGSVVVEIVNFDEADAGGTTLAEENRGVAAGWQRDVDRRFQIVSRRNAGSFDFCLLAVFPVVVGCDQVAISMCEIIDVASLSSMYGTK